MTGTAAAPTDLAVALLHGFLRALHEVGAGATTGKQVDFLRAIVLSPPASVDQLYWRARLTLVTSVEDLPAFDAVFDACFRGGSMPVLGEREPEPDEDGETKAPSPTDDGEMAPQEWAEGSGLRASTADLTHRRTFGLTSPDDQDQLRELRLALHRALPEVSSRRLRRARRGRRLDLRNVLRAAGRSGGEVVRLSWRERPARPRRVLLLIDVSGSQRAHSPDLLRFAHAAVATSPRVEAYTFGTRLTRITAALRHDDVDTALDAVSTVVLDVDGGTRIGDALDEFLADGRSVAHARGALIIVLSDGLERGDVRALGSCAARLARLAHRLVWFSPLACDPAYRPVTAGIQAALPSMDRLAGARDLGSLLAEVEALPQTCAGPRRGAARAWTTTDQSRHGVQSDLAGHGAVS